jgi:hypothetical protein
LRPACGWGRLFALAPGDALPADVAPVLGAGKYWRLQVLRNNLLSWTSRAAYFFKISQPRHELFYADQANLIAATD